MGHFLSNNWLLILIVVGLFIGMASGVQKEKDKTLDRKLKQAQLDDLKRRQSL